MQPLVCKNVSGNLALTGEWLTSWKCERNISACRPVVIFDIQGKSNVQYKPYVMKIINLHKTVTKWYRNPHVRAGLEHIWDTE